MSHSITSTPQTRIDEGWESVVAATARSAAAATPIARRVFSPGAAPIQIRTASIVSAAAAGITASDRA